MKLSQINSLNNKTTNDVVFSKFPVDKTLFEKTDQEIAEIKTQKRRSKTGLRKFKFDTQNQAIEIQKKISISDKLFGICKNISNKEKKISKTKLNMQIKAIAVSAYRIEWTYINGMRSHVAYYPNNMMVITNANGQFCYANNILYATSTNFHSEIINGIQYIVFNYPDGKIYSTDTSQFIYVY